MLKFKAAYLQLKFVFNQKKNNYRDILPASPYIYCESVVDRYDSCFVLAQRATVISIIEPLRH